MNKKYDIVLCPVLRKKWVHYNIELHGAGGKKTRGAKIGIQYSSVNHGSVDYLAFRPDVEMDLEETFNLKIDMESIAKRFLNKRFYGQREREHLINNVESISIRNPIYYCLKSKLVWQSTEDRHDAPVFSEKLIEFKEYKRGSDVYVTGCQRDSKMNYDDGGSIEISRMTVKKAKNIYHMLLNGEIKTKDFKDYCYCEMHRLMKEEFSNIV